MVDWLRSHLAAGSPPRKTRGSSRSRRQRPPATHRLRRRADAASAAPYRRHQSDHVNAAAKSAVCGCGCPASSSEISSTMAPVATPKLTDTCWPTLAMPVAAPICLARPPRR